MREIIFQIKLPHEDYSFPPLRTREVSIPRFKLEQNYDLIENLKKMGLTDIFQQSGDFSRMTTEKVTMNWVSKTTALIRNKPSMLLFVCLVLKPSLHS